MQAANCRTCIATRHDQLPAQIIGTVHSVRQASCTSPAIPIRLGAAHSWARRYRHRAWILSPLLHLPDCRINPDTTKIHAIVSSWQQEPGTVGHNPDVSR